MENRKDDVYKIISRMVLCLLMGSAFAVANLMPNVDEKNCNGCGKCVDKCPPKMPLA
jgi:NAD-dependent dihydropyrimidine dehydrogenase PreA subunit